MIHQKLFTEETIFCERLPVSLPPSLASDQPSFLNNPWDVQVQRNS